MSVRTIQESERRVGRLFAYVALVLFLMILAGYALA
jgi:hypothetical protein